jgi:hypothetical protein
MLALTASYLGYLNGRVTSYKSGVETDLSVFAYVDASAELPFTDCRLADVKYVNRGDRVPWFRRTTDTTYQPLTNWDSTWRAKLLRSCGSALVALNVTKGATTYPTMVKTSEFALVNTVPTTWDNTLTTNNATENVLAEMEGQITDAQNLSSNLMIYGLNETWRMSPSQTAEVWDYEKLFDKGSVNANCSVEVEGLNYVFGPTDIWKHDGNSFTSICDLKTRRFIFSTLNLNKARRFFVLHDRNRKEIRFCYVSGDGFLSFAGAEGCNRCAVYNYAEPNWTFDDLPFAFSGASVNLDTTLAWNTVTSAWDTIGGTWLDQEDSIKKVLTIVGDANTTYSLQASLYAVDLQGQGSMIAYDVDTHATQPRTLYKDGIDLDGLPDLEDLRGYKVVSSLYPQASFEAGAAPLEFSVGSADNYNQGVTFTDWQTYDGVINDRCDFDSAGRYLYLRVRHNDYHAFELTGIDVDAYVTGGA